jgi:hypothetical protein
MIDAAGTPVAFTLSILYKPNGQLYAASGRPGAVGFHHHFHDGSFN